MADKIINPFTDTPASNPMPIPYYGSEFLPDVRELQVGFGNNVFRADKNGQWLGADTFDSAPFSVDMQGNVIANSIAITGGTITGTIIILGGTDNEEGYLQIEDASGNVILQADKDGYHVYDTSAHELTRLNSTGLHTFNTSGVLLAEYLGTGVFMYGDAGINFKHSSSDGSITGVVGATSDGELIVSSDNGNDLFLGGDVDAHLAALNGDVIISADNDIRLGVAGGAIYLYGKSFVIGDDTTIQDIGSDVLITCGGSLKTAIVPTSKGYKALYTNESPDVWFMDFYKDEPDSLFMEVTTPPYHKIKCEDGFIQIWGKRKGYEDIRFQEKTKKQFIKNNEFWAIS